MKTVNDVFGMFFVLLAVHSSVFAQVPGPPAPRLQTMTNEVVSDGRLQFRFAFDSDMSPYSSAQLTYRFRTTNGLNSDPKVVPPGVSGDKSAVVFQIPLSDLSNAQTITLKLSAADASNAVGYVSPEFTIGVGHINDLARAGKDIADLRQEAAALRNDQVIKDGIIKSLLARVDPTSILFVERKMVSDDTIVVTFSTDNPTRIRATITAPNFKREITTDVVATEHVVTFERLKDALSYEIEAEALSVSGKQINVKVAPTENKALRIATISTQERPDPQISIAPSHDHLDVKVFADQDGFIQIEYADVINPSTSQKGELKQYGSIGRDAYGLPTGFQIRKGPNEIRLSGLKPQTSYAVNATVISVYGKRAKTEWNTQIATTAVPVRLEFAEDEPLSVDASPLGIKVNWRSTVAPKTAVFEVLLGKTTTITEEADADGTRTALSATISVADSIGLFKKAVASKETPVLRVTMSDGITTTRRTFRMTFSIPNLNQVASAALTGPEKAAVTDVVKNVQSGKKVDWAKLLSVGLALVAAVP